jgi:hypothetical protein
LIEFAPHQYLVRVTLVVRQLHLVTARSFEEAGRLGPESEIVGDSEIVDILDSVPIDRIR